MWLWLLLPSAALACIPMKHPDGGIPVGGCSILQAWDLTTCGAALPAKGGVCTTPVLTKTAVACTTSPYTQVYLKGSAANQFAEPLQNIRCDIPTKTWFLTDSMGNTADFAEVELEAGAPLLFACSKP